MARILDEILIPDVTLIIMQYYSPIFSKKYEKLSIDELIVYHYLLVRDKAHYNTLREAHAAKAQYVLAGLGKTRYLTNKKDPRIMAYAAGSPVTRSLGLIKWLHREGFVVEKSAMSCAAACNHEQGLERMQWMSKMGFPVASGEIMNCAVVCNHEQGLIRMQWLYEMKYPFDVWTMAKAAGCAHEQGLKRLQWLHEMKCPSSSVWTMAYAAACEHEQGLERLQWLHKMNFPGDEWTMRYAAGCNHEQGLERLQWLHKMKFPGDWAMYGAVLCEHKQSLERMKWLHANKYPINARIFAYASRSPQSLECMLWMIENNFPIAQDDLARAIERFPQLGPAAS